MHEGLAQIDILCALGLRPVFGRKHKAVVKNRPVEGVHCRLLYAGVYIFMCLQLLSASPVCKAVCECVKQWLVRAPRGSELGGLRSWCTR